MDAELKFFSEKFSEKYLKIEKHSGMQREPDHVLYGLMAGIESVINQQIPFDHAENQYDVSENQFNAVCEILNRYVDNPQELTGFYDIEGELRDRGVSRPVASVILTYLKSRGSYLDVINRMDSDNSPLECREFNIPERIM